MKRVEAERSDLLLPYLDRFIEEIGALDQASARWTLAQLFGRMADDLTASQRKRATELMQRNLTDQDDWIVLNRAMETLTDWAAEEVLRNWLLPQLKRLAKDRRKSVSARARKFAARLAGETQ